MLRTTGSPDTKYYYINELKYEWGANSFCLNDLWAAEACLSITLRAYDLMGLFRQAVVKTAVAAIAAEDMQHTLTTLRHKLPAKAGCLAHRGCEDIFRLALAMCRREWLTGLWDRPITFELPVHFSPTVTTQGRG